MGTKSISLIGLGKLGSPMAACMAAKGHRVVGVDRNESFVRQINQGIAPVFEPGLEEMISRSQGRLSATTDLKKAVLETDITFVIVPTPSLPDGSFSTKYVLEAVADLAGALAEKKDYHIVVLTSTVMPGTTGGELKQALEQASGKCCGEDFGLCYSPEFISLGNAIYNFLNPDYVLIGQSDPKAGEQLSEIYRSVCENDPPITRMSFANAELTKLAVNTFVTTKISYANMLAQICERLDEGCVDVVTSAVGQDSRVGRKFLKGAIGYGGPCFPRDNRALIRLAEQLNVPAPLPIATDQINSHQISRLRDLVMQHRIEGGKVGILGLAYKPQTNVVEQSQGLMLAQQLLAEGVSVHVYDPHAHENARPLLQGSVEFASSAAAVAGSVDVLVITLPCEEFQSLTAGDVSRPGAEMSIIDCWRILPREQFESCCHYVPIGQCKLEEGKLEEASDVIPFVQHSPLKKEAA